MGSLANSKARKGLFSLAALTAVAVAVFFWNEARKEIYFLCGNFTPGITEASVRQQLDTGDFLQHRTTTTASGSRITVNSWYTLKTVSCTIEIGKDNVVASTIFN